MIRKVSFAFLFFLSACPLPLSDGAHAQGLTTPKPGLVVAFDRQLLRREQSIKATIWVSNDSEKTLSSSQINIASPSFLEWHDQSPDGKVVTLPLQLGPLPLHKSHSVVLFATLKDTFDVGDFNLLFIVPYTWQAGRSQQESVVWVEKSIKVDIFGTDNVLGVPLVFASFVLPGLFWLITMRLIFKVPFAQTPEKDDKLIFSVMVSAMIIATATFIRHWRDWPLLENFSLNSQVGPEKLFYLMLVGVALGVAWGSVYRFLRFWQTREALRLEKERRIDINDDDATLLNKILLLNPAYNGTPVMVCLKNGCKYSGFHYAVTSQTVYLVGAFKVEKENLAETTQETILHEGLFDSDGNLIQEASKLRGSLEIITQLEGKVNVDSRDFIGQVIESDHFITDMKYLSWKVEEISAVVPYWARKGKLLEFV